MEAVQYSKVEAIKSRKSVRSFSSASLTAEDVSEIKAYFKHSIFEMGPFGHRIEFHYSRVSNNITSKGEKIGTYGVIKNPSAYLVSVCKNTREHMLDLGYLFEKAIIFLQAKGIGSCWLGGTFKRETFHQKYDIHGNKIIPIIVPIGYPKDSPRFMENAMRKLVNADNRIPWESLFFHNDFKTPLTHEVAGLYEEMFEMVRIGPSASNKQPWRLVYDQERHAVHFYVSRTPNYANKIPFDMQLIDMGIAMYHFEASALELKHQLKWSFDYESYLEDLPENMAYIATAILSEF